MSTNKGALDLNKKSRLEHTKSEHPKYISSIGFLRGWKVVLFVHGPNLIFFFQVYSFSLEFSEGSR